MGHPHQHRVANCHLRNFLSPRQGNGELYVYSNRTGQILAHRPTKWIACYGENHSSAVEQRMARIESRVAPLLRGLNDTARKLVPCELGPLFEYVALLGTRGPGMEEYLRRGLERLQVQRQDLWEEVERQKEVDALRSTLLDSIRPMIVGTLQQYPNWETISPLGRDEEYLVCDTPAVIALPKAQRLASRSIGVLMPISRKTLLIGYGSEAVLSDVSFLASPINSFLVAYAAQEVYSHRKLDPDGLSRMILLAPLAYIAPHLKYDRFS